MQNQALLDFLVKKQLQDMLEGTCGTCVPRFEQTWAEGSVVCCAHCCGGLCTRRGALWRTLKSRWVWRTFSGALQVEMSQMSHALLEEMSLLASITRVQTTGDGVLVSWQGSGRCLWFEPLTHIAATTSRHPIFLTAMPGLCVGRK